MDAWNGTRARFRNDVRGARRVLPGRPSRGVHVERAGTLEIYVRPLEGDGGPWRVSTGGGAHPVWSKSSSELLFTTEDQILTARYRYDGREFKVEPPRAWSAVRYATAGPTRKFDLHPDGARVVVAGPQTADEAAHDTVVFVTNFFEELDRLLPPGR